MPSQRNSTLFPYTTLFRSDDASEACARRIIRVEEFETHARLVDAGAGGLGPDDACLQLALRLSGKLQQHLHHVADRDRKSTRLNSSHVSISYAVFCLKKKK